MLFFQKYDNEITRSTRNARNTATGGPVVTEQRDKPRNQSPGAVSSSKTSSSAAAAVDHQRQFETAHKGPHRYLFEAGSAEKVRNRNAKTLLLDMFGM